MCGQATSASLVRLLNASRTVESISFTLASHISVTARRAPLWTLGAS